MGSPFAHSWSITAVCGHDYCVKQQINITKLITTTPESPVHCITFQKLFYLKNDKCFDLLSSISSNTEIHML